jgi:hypothetical protein
MAGVLGGDVLYDKEVATHDCRCLLGATGHCKIIGSGLAACGTEIPSYMGITGKGAPTNPEVWVS